jgi:hypothetical protein
MKNTGLQHGDVLLKRIAKLPTGLTEVQRRDGCLVIAEGEATGHHHVITATPAKLYELKGELYLEVTEPVTITHEEHKTLPIPPGIYEIGIVKEYDYFAEMERRVVD